MYTAFKNSLEILIKNNLNSIKTVDWYNRQYDRCKDLKAIEFPACYIEFENPLNWQTNGNGLQIAETTIKVHLVNFDVADSPVASLNLANELHKTLHGKRLMDGQEQLSTELMRTQSQMVQDYDQLKIIVLTYKCTLFDLTTLTRYTEVTPDFVVTVK